LVCQLIEYHSRRRKKLWKWCVFDRWRERERE